MMYVKKRDPITRGCSCIHYTGSVKGMKKLGYWKKHDRCVRQGQYIYNLDSKYDGYK